MNKNTKRPVNRSGGRPQTIVDTQALIKVLTAQRFDPALKQIELYNDPSTNAQVKSKINEIFMRMLYPVKKVVAPETKKRITNLQVEWGSGEPPTVDDEEDDDAA